MARHHQHDNSNVLSESSHARTESQDLTQESILVHTSDQNQYSSHSRNDSNLTYDSEDPIQLPVTTRRTISPTTPTSPQINIPARISSWKRTTVIKHSPESPTNNKIQKRTSRSEEPPPALKMSVTSDETYETQDTRATSVLLGPLQAKEELDYLAPVEDNEDDPSSYDLVAPVSEAESNGYSLEKRSEELFSRDHLLTIFSEPALLLKFTGFLSKYRPNSVQVLIYYLDALKAMKAIAYSNAIAEALEPLPGHSFTEAEMIKTVNNQLQEKADRAFDIMVNEDLPAYITHVYIKVVSESITRRITGTLPPHLREASEGLAEVFCLSDPSRPDNPIVFASEEFHRTTQYGVNYAIGRNCRFLQGPKSSPHSVRRLREACQKGVEHYETFLNYRRDGSQFMNLLMMSPLRDSRGTIRYFIGAQVDVSGLVRDCTEMASLQRLVDARNAEIEAEANTPNPNTTQQQQHQYQDPQKDEFQSLTEMFNASELRTVRQHGGRMHSQTVDDRHLHSTADSISASDSGAGRGANTATTTASSRPRLLLAENSDPEIEPTPFRPASSISNTSQQHPTNFPSSVPAATGAPQSASTSFNSTSGRLGGIYANYLLLRPAPSLRILFASPSLRVPGMLQSPFLDRIGGSARVRDELEQALIEGRGVTAKVRWVTRFNNTNSNNYQGAGAGAGGDGMGMGTGNEGRSRWIHCTPLMGSNGNIGVWMVVLVDPVDAAGGILGAGGVGADQRRRYRVAPPVERVGRDGGYGGGSGSGREGGRSREEGDERRGGAGAGRNPLGRFDVAKGSVENLRRAAGGMGRGSREGLRRDAGYEASLDGRSLNSVGL